MVHNNLIIIAPHLNHYKVRLLNRLQQSGLNVIVISGKLLHESGFAESRDRKEFSLVEIRVNKQAFGRSFRVFCVFIRLIYCYKPKWIVIPGEIKYMLLIGFSSIVKRICAFQLVAWTHAINHKRESKFKVALKKLLFLLFDKVIFYSEKSMLTALSNGDVSASKAYFANNAYDTGFDQPDMTPYSGQSSILFLGRLVDSKRVDLLLKYYDEIKRFSPGLKLLVIGDGPDRKFIETASKKDSNIEWFGALTEEDKIREVFAKTKVVFSPGAVGLVVNHAFAYGKPVIAIDSSLNGSQHGPEIDFLKDNKNGLLLSGSFKNNVQRIVNLLSDDQIYRNFQSSIIEVSMQTDPQAWCNSFTLALRNRVRNRNR